MSDKLESARFVLASDQAAEKLMDGVEKILADSAARGFPVPGGDTLGLILDITDETRATVLEANGKVYDERSGQIYEVEKFALDYLVKLAKLAMELYREQLVNAIALEVAQQAADTERSKAEIARLNAQTEARMAAIIRNKAEAERLIIPLKQALIAAEELTISAESALEDAKLVTAQKKLEIIDSLYQIIAAEQLVLEAEMRKAATLELVLVAQQEVAAVKRQMVPFYIQKAEARQLLAIATEQEIPVLKAIEELGYQRIALRNAEEAEKHQERQLELENEIVQENYLRAHSAYQIAQKQLATLLQQYANDVKAVILEQQKQLQEDEVAFRLATGLAREAIVVNTEVQTGTHERLNINAEIGSLMTNIEARAQDMVSRIRAAALTNDKRTISHLWSKYIREGFIVG